jgi:hypothetical protein
MPKRDDDTRKNKARPRQDQESHLFWVRPSLCSVSCVISCIDAREIYKRVDQERKEEEQEPVLENKIQD